MRDEVELANDASLAPESETQVVDEQALLQELQTTQDLQRIYELQRLVPDYEIYERLILRGGEIDRDFLGMPNVLQTVVWNASDRLDDPHYNGSRAMWGEDFYAAAMTHVASAARQLYNASDHSPHALRYGVELTLEAGEDREFRMQYREPNSWFTINLPREAMDAVPRDVAPVLRALSSRQFPPTLAKRGTSRIEFFLDTLRPERIQGGGLSYGSPHFRFYRRPVIETDRTVGRGIGILDAKVGVDSFAYVCRWLFKETKVTHVEQGRPEI